MWVRLAQILRAASILPALLCLPVNFTSGLRTAVWDVVSTNVIMQPRQKQRSAVSRKKSCLQCARSKTRCGLERPFCHRCATARRECVYATPVEDPPVGSRFSLLSDPSLPPILNITTPVSSSTVFTFSPDVAHVGSTAESDPTALPLPPTPANHEDGALDFSDLDLIPFPDADHIRDRLLRPFFSVREQVPKTFQPYTLQYITCVLRTYVKQLAGNICVPPIIHSIQMSNGNTSVALANCCSLVRLWDQHAAGSEAMVAEIIQREMSRLENCVGRTIFRRPLNSD